ncbi:hypothetical protein F5887DRAFT_1282352 [Amanita rubescens]|nr:hypothetical protein F5887DRAFT_1282352 [Amanita rubescens]
MYDDDESVVSTKDGLVTVSQNAGASDCYPSSDWSIVDVRMILDELKMNRKCIDEMKREVEDLERKMEDFRRETEDFGGDLEIEDQGTARLDLEDDIQMEELHINIVMSKTTRSLWRGPSSH